MLPSRFAVLALILFGPALLRAAAPPAAGSVVTMTPFEVQANALDFRRWIKVGSPNFVIYTDAKPAEASLALRELEMQHAATQLFLGRRPLKSAPTTLILPTNDSDWTKLASKGNVEWKVAVSSEADEISDLIVVQYDWQDYGSSIVRAAQAKSELRRLHFKAPFWFHRGIGTFFETAEFTKDSVRLGRENPRIRHLNHRDWLRWGRFFEVDEKAEEFTKENKISLYEGQSTLLLQYIFTHPDASWTKRLTAWLDYLNAGHAPTETEFKQIFQHDFKAWQQTLERYMQGGQYRIYTVKVPAEALKFPETKVQPSVTEMRELFILAQILTQSVAASQTSLDGLLAKELKTDSLRPFLVAACLEWKREDAALAELRRLIASGTDNPAVYLLAAARLFARRVPVLGPHGRLGDEVTEIRQWCRRALDLEPLHPPASELLAWAEALAPEVDQQGIATIEALYARQRQRWPVDDLISALAVALWRAGEHETARALGLKLQEDALGSKDSRAIAAQVLALLPDAPAAPVR